MKKLKRLSQRAQKVRVFGWRGIRTKNPLQKGVAAGCPVRRAHGGKQVISGFSSDTVNQDGGFVGSSPLSSRLPH